MKLKINSAITVVAFIAVIILACVVLIWYGHDIPAISRNPLSLRYAPEPGESGGAVSTISKRPDERSALTETQHALFDESAKEQAIPEYLYKLPEWRVKLLKALFRPVSIECYEVPFEDAVRELAEKLGVKIEIDPLVLGKKLKAYLKHEKVDALIVLYWLTSMDDSEEIGFRLQDGRIVITLGQNEKWSNSDIVFFRLDTARQNIWLREQEQKYLRQLEETAAHRFNWDEKSVSQALDEIRAAYNLKIDDSYITHWSELQDKAPRASWEITAFEALETLLENTPFNFAVVAYEKSLTVRLWQRYEGEKTLQQHYQTKYERFDHVRIDGKIEDEPFHKLIRRLEQPLGVLIYTDESTWEAGIKVNFPGENTTAKELLDYLHEKHGIEHWFESDTETGRETLFLLKNQ